MAKYHIGKNGPSLCRAQKGNCPLGGEHFDNINDAYTFNNDLLKHANINSLSKNRKSRNNGENIYDQLFSHSDQYPREILIQLSDFLKSQRNEPLSIIPGGSSLYNSQLSGKKVHDYDFTVFMEPLSNKSGNKFKQHLSGELDVNLVPVNIALDKINRSLPLIESYAAYRNNLSLGVNKNNNWSSFLNNISVSPVAHRQLINEFMVSNLLNNVNEQPISYEDKIFKNFKHSVRYSIYLRRNDFDNFDPRLSLDEREYFLNTLNKGYFTPEINTALSDYMNKNNINIG